MSADTTASTDTTNRQVCNELFDALERGDVHTIDRLYAPGMTMWFNVSNAEISREENLRAIEQGTGLHRRRTYDDRQIRTFHDGFLAQYTCRVVGKDGSAVPLSACLVGTVHDGQIVHLAEYLDMGRFGRSRERRA